MAEVEILLNAHAKHDWQARQERQMDLVEVLGFLFMLSTMELGRVSSLGPANQRQIILLVGHF